MQSLWVVGLLLVAAPGYRQSVESWRTEREAKLKAPDGWLTLIGLFWLEEGKNTTGSAKGNRVKLPVGLPERAGMFIRRGRTVEWQPQAGASRVVRTDKSGSPDIIPVGRLRLHVIERGAKIGVRIKDSESSYRREFRGLIWYPITEEWNVKARFVPEPRTVVFDAQAGDPQRMQSPGYAEWTWRGQKLRLTPVLEDDQLFFVFRDKTAGKTTYPAARFLYADLPKNGYIRLDFNKAYNPPCVFTPYATCPLPPPYNRLIVPVEAGEKMYSAH